MTPPFQDMASVIMPVYNQDPEHLAAALQSMWAQTAYQMGVMELIIVVDGANEETVARVRSEVDKNAARLNPDHSIYGNTLVVERAQNRGIAASLNQGYALARGKFTTWVSSDNDYDPEMIWALLTEITRDLRARLVYTDYRVISRVTGEPPPWALDPGRRSCFDHDTDEFALVKVLRNGGIGFSCLYYTEDALALPSRPSVECAEDLDFHVRLAKRYPRGFKLVPGCLMTNYLEGVHAYTTHQRPRVLRALTEVYLRELLGEPLRQSGLKVFFVRPGDAKQIIKIKAMPPLTMGGNHIVCLLVPRGEQHMWILKCLSQEFSLFVQMVVEEDEVA